MSDANAFLMGTGVPSIKFPVVNAKVVIDPIIDVELAQQVDFKTRKPLFYDDRKPRMQLIVTGRTSERDSTIENDDGTRKLYIKSQMRQAVREAVLAAGAQALERGGSLAVQWVGEEEAGPGMSPKKLYAAQYRPPVVAGQQPAGNLFAGAANADDLL